MDAETALARFAATIDAHDWEGLRALLHPDFVCRLVHTGEEFARDAWVDFNAEYPGFERLHLDDAVVSGDRAVGRAHVVGRNAMGEPEHFAVACFLTVRDGLIAESVEVWADLYGGPPSERRA